MRITGWHVDGYGVLGDLHTSDLPAGLSVVVGPNEAGKSTLLDFLRGILFGFPDRRSRLPYHQPLHGGRHGGRLELLDDSGRRWSLGRYVGARELRLDGPEGPAGEEQLRRLLGGADAALFRSVFAFGLDELASLETLDRDEVRDAVFSAGILGAGRSAQRAAKALGKRREQLARPRRADALANRLQAELEEHEEQLRQARRTALGHPARRVEEQRLAAEVTAARRRADELRAAVAELDQLAAAWPLHCRLLAARDELAALGRLDRRPEALLANRRLLGELAAERAGHEQRLQRQAELSTQLGGIDRERESLLAELEPSLAARRPGFSERDRTIAGEAEELAGRRRELLAALAAARADLGRLTDEQRAAAAELEAAIVGGSRPRPLAVIEELEVSAGQLRSELDERDRRRAERAAAEQAEALARLATGAAGAAASRRIVLVLAATALLFCAAAALVAGRHELSLAAVCALCAAVLTGAAVLLRRAEGASSGGPAPSAGAAGTRRRQTARPGDEAARRSADTGTGAGRDSSCGAPGSAGASVDHRLERCEAAVGALASSLGLGAEPTPAEVAALVARLASERSRRVQEDLLAANARRAGRACQAAEQRLSAGEDELSALESRVDELCSAAGVRAGIGAGGLCRVLAGLEQLDKLDAARRRVVAPLERLGAEIEGFAARLAALLESLGDPAPASASEASAALAELDAELQAAIDRQEKLQRLERAGEEAEEELAARLGTGPSGARLRAALAGGDLLSWNQQRSELAAELEQAAAAHEQAVAAHRDAEVAIAEVESSGTIAELELACASTGAALDTALVEWLETALAEALLDQTLARYERERQPLVVARAASLFATVTAGRYPALVAREDESGRSHAVEALTAAGERVDCGSLSRGTAEQLYLCLRLAYAGTFAERASALPLVLDDVLVNFDPARAAATAAAIAETAASHQVLFFTCHPQVVEMLTAVSADAAVVELPSARPPEARSAPAVHYPLTPAPGEGDGEAPPLSA